MGEQLAFVISSAAGINKAVPEVGFKRIGLPLVEGIGRLDIVVAVQNHPLRRGTPGRSPYNRMSPGGDAMGIQPEFFQVIG
ncbi:MAG: hypothetical protein BWY71_01096 [Planctomycetes bacterium ADurb.Bin412]|nr:MAG: hypothetical protein BWY71_01096 [Planctomycetes bacterium ADurb.Bin412]